MKVDLSDEYQGELARAIARRIHGVVISMHIRLTGTPDTFGGAKRTIRDVRDLLRSIPHDGTRFSERREFIRWVKYSFREIRRENHTETRWQEHIAKVRAAHPDLITPECEAKLGASGWKQAA